MLQPLSWLIASLLLVTAAACVFVRSYRALGKRLEDERQHAQRMSALHLATLEALALAIDAKDQTARNHIRRVQHFATGLAEALGLGGDELQALRTAALLHDIGKLAVPEHILAKPGPLTPEEFQKVRAHPQVGADIIAAVPFPYPVAPLILSHHERWDGRGYPQGLKGTEIPIGARILCLADYFEALTSDRPYHKAISTADALAILQQEAGKALDPDLVAAFAAALPRLDDATSEWRCGVPTPAELIANIVDTAAPEPARSSVFDHIAIAQREAYALYDLAQSMGTRLGVSDTMVLIASKLSSLVPFSACALFLYVEASDTLYCRFATGIDSEIIQQLSLKSGQGLTGWVARNRRSLLNAWPVLDLEAAGSNLPTALQSALVSPLVAGDRLIGTIGVYHESARFYGEDHRRLLERVCAQAAAVIANSLVFEQTQEASLTDPLTNLPNTRFMFMHLARELSRAERLKAEVSLLVMDVNGFKEINDTYGHHAGDRALRQIAQVLRSAIRPYDICVRYAGDEFVVVLAGCGYDEAERKRIELQSAIERFEFEPRPGRRLPLSISAGTAVFPHDGHTYESLLAVADSRMYLNKSSRKRDVHRQLTPGTLAADLGDADAV
jgi:diguanylate cyclase (GGDEF)-like protein/putative nucleotidyltransferase with HDIG domain